MSMEEYRMKEAENSLPDEFFVNHTRRVFHMYKAFNYKTLDKLPGDSPLTVSDRHNIVRLVDYVELYHVGSMLQPDFTPMSDFIRSGDASKVEHQSALFAMTETCMSYLYVKEANQSDMKDIVMTITEVKKILERVRTAPLAGVRPVPRFILYGDEAKREHKATLMAMLEKVTTHFKDGLEKDYYCDATPADREVATIIEEVDKLTESVRLLLFYPGPVDAIQEDE